MTRPQRDIVVIGGSSGSGAVLKTVLSGLPPDLPASIFISTHMPPHAAGTLAQMLSATSALPIIAATEGQTVQPGHAYVAVPDAHLLLVDGTIRLGAGPRENMARPAIDPMFRSAALAYGPRVIGVVLSGMLNDGAAGLHAIKLAAGLAVVQHPLDAEADEMPLAALATVQVDHVASAADLAPLLATLVGTEAPAAPPLSEDLRMEVEIAAGTSAGSRVLAQIARPSPLTCPACHGVLSEMQGTRPLRYRCQMGHAFTAEAVAASTADLDEAIGVALRVMEERVTLVERMALDAREIGRDAVAMLYDARAEEYRRYAITLRQAAVSALRERGARKRGDA